MSSESQVQFSDLKFPADIGYAIDAAHAAAQKGDIDVGVRWFDLCRTLLLSSSPTVPLKRRIDANWKSISGEAERCRDALQKKASQPAKTRIVVLGDSLALPRPEEKENFPASLDNTYPSIILSRVQSAGDLGGGQIWTHCQRYFTTQNAVDLLEQNQDVLAGAHVIFHLGLNDCAVRMFMDDQRLAIGLLPPEIEAKILGFSRTYRAALIRSFPGFSYVPVQQYRANLHRIAAMAKDAGAESLTFTSVVVVPWKFWPGTPGICHNFTTYNLAMMDVAAQVGANVLDIDRLMWQNNVETTLLKDGMHLSPVGHRHVADAWMKMIFNI